MRRHNDETYDTPNNDGNEVSQSLHASSRAAVGEAEDDSFMQSSSSRMTHESESPLYERGMEEKS